MRYISPLYLVASWLYDDIYQRYADIDGCDSDKKIDNGMTSVKESHIQLLVECV